MVKKKEVNKLCDKNILVAGICVIFLGIIVGMLLMVLGLTKLNNYQKNYTVERKEEYENNIKIVEMELNEIAENAVNLELKKKNLQQELNEIYENSGHSEEYYNKEEEINSNELEIIKNDNLKYEKISEKNELKKVLNEIVSNLDYNQNRFIYVLPGLLLIIFSIIIGFIIISISYKQDKDDLAFNSTPIGPLKTIDEIEKSNKNQNKNDDIKLPSYRKD